MSGEELGIGATVPWSTSSSVAPPGAPAVTAAPVARPASVRRRPRSKAVALAIGVLVAAAAGIYLSGVLAGASAQDIAQAINLRASDLPGFTVAADEHTGGGAQLDARMRRCLGGDVGNHSGSVDASSPTFTSGAGLTAENVGSSVSIETSPAVVARDLALVRSARVEGCLTQAFHGFSFATSHGVPITFEGVRTFPIQVLSHGFDGGYGTRMIIDMSAAGIRLPMVMDLFAFAVGRDELGLHTFTVARPFPPATEQQLGAVLVSRALARPH